MEKDVHWFISATTPPKKPLQLRSNKKITLELPDTIHLNGKVRRTGKRQLQLGFTIQSKDRNGLSIYKAGKRVPVSYKILSSQGSPLAWGKMNYG